MHKLSYVAFTTSITIRLPGSYILFNQCNYHATIMHINSFALYMTSFIHSIIHFIQALYSFVFVNHVFFICCDQIPSTVDSGMLVSEPFDRGKLFMDTYKGNTNTSTVLYVLHAFYHIFIIPYLFDCDWCSCFAMCGICRENMIGVGGGILTGSSACLSKYSEHTVRTRYHHFTPLSQLFAGNIHT